MSTKMYCYRIEKDQLWPFLDRVRQYYLDREGICQLLKTFEQSLEGLDKAMLYATDRDFHVDVQLFDEGKTWLFRILEAGYFFMNSQKKQFPEIEQVFYDDRTDVPDECLKNEEAADWVDEQLRQRHYLMAPIISQKSMMDIYYNQGSS